MPEAAQSRRDQELTGVSHVPAREPQGLRPLDPLQVAWLGRSRPGGGRDREKFCSPLAARPFCSTHCHLAVEGLPPPPAHPSGLLSVTAEGFLLNVFVHFPMFLRVIPHQKLALLSAAFVPSRGSQPDHVSPTWKRPPGAVKSLPHKGLKAA